MIPDKVLYTDGHNVVVTDSVFKVKNTSYNINGITKHALFTMPPERLPGIFLLTIGLALALCGFFQIIPSTLVRDIWYKDVLITGNTLAISIGLLFVLIGIIVMAFMHKRYAVRIATAEGEKNVIVSRHRDYVQQIVNALNEAFNFRKKSK